MAYQSFQEISQKLNELELPLLTQQHARELALNTGDARAVRCIYMELCGELRELEGGGDRNARNRARKQAQARMFK